MTVLGALVYKNFLLLDSETEKAVEGFDKAIRQFREGLRQIDVSDQGGSEYRMSKYAGLVAEALVGKGIALARREEAISEEEAETLLVCMGMLDVSPEGGIEILVRFAVSVGPARALNLIEKGPEVLKAETLLPLVTALKHELGQSSRVAREVDEVAADIQYRLAESDVSGHASVVGRKGNFRSGSNMVLRIEEPFPPVRSIITRNGSLEKEDRLNENVTEREVEIQPGLVVVLQGEAGTVPMEWGIFDRHVEDADYAEAWELGSWLFEDPNYFDRLADSMRPYFLNSMFLAAYHTGRMPEALNFVERAFEACRPDMDPLYKTILSNRVLALSRLGRFTEAYGTLDHVLRIDPAFVMALYNGLCVACMGKDEEEFGRWYKRLTAYATMWRLEDVNQVVEALETDSDVCWGWEQGLIQPLVRELRKVRGDM